MAKTKRIEPTAQALREIMGLSKGYACDLANGKCRPSLALAVRIESEMGVPVKDWPLAKETA